MPLPPPLSFVSSLMTFSIRLVAAVALAILFLRPAGPAVAQEWRQEIQIITPVEFGAPTHVLLDSLDAALKRRPDLRLRRAPDAPAQSYDALREALYTDGLDLRSATHAFLRYRFDLAAQGTGVVESLESLTFIVRLDEARVDRPILHLDTRAPFVGRLLATSGIPSPVNMRSMTPFRTLVAYPYLTAHQETSLVEFGRQTMRTALPPRQAAVLDLLDEHMVMGTYALNTRAEQVAAAGR